MAHDRDSRLGTGVTLRSPLLSRIRKLLISGKWNTCLATIANHCQSVPIIAIHFDHFSDGEGARETFASASSPMLGFMHDDVAHGNAQTACAAKQDPRLTLRLVASVWHARDIAAKRNQTNTCCAQRPTTSALYISGLRAMPRWRCGQATTRISQRASCQDAGVRQCKTCDDAMRTHAPETRCGRLATSWTKRPQWR